MADEKKAIEEMDNNEILFEFLKTIIESHFFGEINIKFKFGECVAVNRILETLNVEAMREQVQINDKLK